MHLVSLVHGGPYPEKCSNEPCAAIPGEIWPRRRQRRLRPPDPSSVPPTHYQGLIRQAQKVKLQLNVTTAHALKQCVICEGSVLKSSPNSWTLPRTMGSKYGLVRNNS